MNPKKYWIFTSLATFILLPVWLNVDLMLLIVARELAIRRPGGTAVALALLGLLLTLALPYAIYAFGKKTTLPDTFLSRYGPFIAPIAFTLVVWLFISSISGGNFTEKSTVGTIIVVFLPFFLFLLFFAFVDICNWAIPISAIAAYLFFIACFAVGTWRGGRFRTKENKKALCVLTSILILACIAAIQSIIQYQSIPISNP